MKKIMVISNTVPPETNGQATMLGRLFSDISEDNHFYVQRLAYMNKDVKIKRDNVFTILPMIPIKKSSHKILKGISLLTFPFDIVPLAKKIEKLAIKHKIDKMIICTGSLADAPAAYLVCKKLKIPYSFYIFDNYVEQQKLLPLKMVAKRFEHRLVRNAEHIIVTNEVMAAEIKSKYDVCSELIRNPCDTSRYNKVNNKIVDDEHKKHIIYTGEIYSAQINPILTLIKSINKSNKPMYKLHIYSNITSDILLINKLSMFLSNKRINQLVEFHGFVKNNKIPELQINADILFLPLSTKCGYSKELIATSAPSKFSEYLAAGRPLIVFAPVDSYVHNFIISHNCGYTITENNSLTGDFVEVWETDNVLNDMIQQPEEQLIKMNNAREISKEFDIITNKNKFMKLLE